MGRGLETPPWWDGNACRPKCPSASPLAPIRLVRIERKVDGYRRPPPKSPIAQCVRPPFRLVRMEPKVDSYAGSQPKSPIAQCVLPIRLVRMERKIDSYRRPLPKSPIA